MLSLISYQKLSKKELKKRLRLKNGYAAVLDTYEDCFGKINIYRILYYKNKNKAAKNILKICGELPYSGTSDIPEEYFKRLALEILIEKLKKDSRRSVCLHFLPDEKIIAEICKYSAKVYTTSPLSDSFLEKIFKECGTVPAFTSFPVNADYILTGKEKFYLNKLPEPFSEICPCDFDPTLFAALLYKENRFFIK